MRHHHAARFRASTTTTSTGRPRVPRRAVAFTLASGLVAALLGTAAMSPAVAADLVTVTVEDPGFSTSGSWSSSAVLGPDAAPTVYTTGTGASASWQLTAPADGVYRVEVAVPDAANSDGKAAYRVTGGAGAPVSMVVDQNAARGTWATIGLVDLDAGEDAMLVLTRSGTAGGPNTRAASARLVPDAGTVPPLETGLPFSDAHEDGLADWTAVGTSDLGVWSPGTAEFDYLGVSNAASSSGSYIRPTSPIELPDQYRIALSVKIDSTAGSVNLLTDLLAPYSTTANNLAVQLAPSEFKIARPNAGTILCKGGSPIVAGEWFQLEVVRAEGITAVYVNSELVAAVEPGLAGGSISLGAYKSVAQFGGIGIEQLSAAPAGHPTTASGCSWTPSTGAGSPQPVIINQTGFDLGGVKRFTAPSALDGETFQVVDADDSVVYEGTIAGQIGDFSDFDPASTGPYRVLLSGEAGDGESYEFGIGANWTERISYLNAIAFMTDVRCFYGALAGQAMNGTDAKCKTGLAWRDSHQLSFEIPTLVDLYLANPSAIGDIRMPEATYSGLQYPLDADAPEVARLISWGAEIYLTGQYDHVLIKEQLASFLWVYPELSEWIPAELYEAVRDYLFPIWSQASYSRYSWYDYTAHTADLLQVYTQVGTGKGEFPPGHSIVPNLRMWQVAEREGRADAPQYLDAALAQAQWIVDNLDVSDPATTKGQRQAEYQLMTALATLALTVPAESVPAGLGAFAQDWADVVIERSDNMWDFRKYSDDRWTIPNFTGGGSGEDPNETGNLLGFPAAALAASVLIGDADTDARLAEIAQAHVDDVFGRNPTGRAAQYRIHDPELAFEGLDLGWFSEYQGGNGLLQGSHGVFDGSPKNGHYPFNPGVSNIGHTEGWVTFNTAWLEALAWRAFTATAVSLGAVSAPADGSVGVVLRAPLNMDAAGGNTGEVRVSVNDGAPTPVTVTQTGANALDYTADLDLAALGAVQGDVVTVSYGLGPFERSASVTVTAAGTDPDPGADPGEEPPTTTPTVVDPEDADPSLELAATHFELVNGELIAQLGSAAADQWFYAVVHSTPVQLGWFRADAAGQVTVPVPAGLPAGVHTLQLYDASGALVAWGQFSVAAAPGSADLAATGVSVGAVALTLLLAGCAILTGLILQRRRRATP
ncbi:hypothetical protein [Homoserinibacter gongjuensis]|uniref:Golvesin/Xly CBD-like domain-containing protein n=1 Tax=Homoserinibacter gongjuensis TaxID=1162968 RepID=A0ABQ6JUD1_9MICO|nr:hypothetical protein [Homoserinibacter gongjuensis]GMA91903.1 hypothetical protein GCM10025869_24320 [Homoserinibacter gongjuensis]